MDQRDLMVALLMLLGGEATIDSALLLKARLGYVVDFKKVSETEVRLRLREKSV